MFTIIARCAEDAKVIREAGQFLISSEPTYLSSPWAALISIWTCLQDIATLDITFTG